MTDDTEDVKDEREVELSSIAAIFPEIVLDPQDPFSASINLPVTPSLPLAVIFPESSEGPNNIPNGPEIQFDKDASTDMNETDIRPELHHLTHLPSLHLRIALPEGYPHSKPPVFDLSTVPQWLSTAVLERLQADGIRLWKGLGQDQVVFAYIDHLQQSAESTFGLLDGNETLQVAQDLKIALLDFDINEKRNAFKRETFTCGVCLDPKKGSACHRMLNCGHVFCRQCLQDFYNNAITEGDLASVKCLAPDCAKKRSTIGIRRKAKARISPSELLQIPIGQDMVKRYVDLKHKLELESDKNTVYCPRKWCQGAARSRKHRKPSQLNDSASSGEESEVEDEATSSKKGYNAWAELLCICEDCSFAFCRRCYQGWHGEFALCTPRTNTGELTEEDKASLEYLKLHTTPCPTCSVPAQKTYGCNHMICYRCETHFCYLCSAWLEPSNPYQHYNLKTTSCYMRLWELESGDGDDVGNGYAGGVQDRELGDPNAPAEILDIYGEDLEEEEEVVVEEEPPEDLVPPIDQHVEREGPLVLRIGQVPPPVPPAPAALAQPLPEVRRAQNHRYHPRPAGGRHVQNAEAQRRARAEHQGRHFRAPRNAAPPVPRNVAPPGPRAAQGPAQAPGPNAAPAAGAVNAQQRWVEQFVRLALADEEDQIEWDSDDEDEPEWDVPVR